MSKTDKINYLNYTGCSQQGRYSPALDSEYIKIDERSFTDNLVYSLGLSKLLNYYNLQNRPDGDWSEFLTDEAVILAAISFIKPAEFEDKFKKNVYKAISFNKPHKKLKYLKVCFEEIFKVAQKIDTWYQHLKNVEDFQQSELHIRNEISNVVETKLRNGLQKFYSFVLSAKDKNTIHSEFKFDFDSFSFIWQLDNVVSSAAIYNGETLQQRIDSAAEALQNVFQIFYESVIYIRQKALTSLEFSLSQDNHYPEVALLLTFLKLYEYPQNNINKLTGRYLDYYYRKVLKQSERSAINDKAYLTFLLDKEAHEAIVPQGSKFIAGTDDKGKNVFYETKEDILLNKAKLVKLKNLYVARKKLNLDGEAAERVSNIYQSSVPVIDWSQKPSLNKRMSYPTFGEDQEGLGNYDTTMEHARLGMAISSPVLLLSEGKRELTIRIQLEEKVYSKLENEIKKVAKELSCSFKEAIAKSLLDSLSISLSSEEGWLNVKNNIVTIENATHSLLIKFDVDPDKPALVPIDTALHGSEFDSDFPVMRLVLNNQSYIYPYSLLSEIQVDQVIIHTKVMGVKNLLLHNNVGAVNANAPFYPFGPVPKVGSYLVIGNNEIFQKQLENLKINLEWFELPQDSNGFKDYYKDYKLNVENGSYEVSVSILDGGKWMPEQLDEKQKLKLFRTIDKPEAITPSAKHRLHRETRFNNIDMDLIRMAPDYKSISEKLQYSSMSKRGFLKLELINPMHAFGHDVYPAIVSDITLENSKSGFLKGKTKKDLPRAAFTPQIRSISVDYESISVLSMKENFTTEEEKATGKIFHLHPYGSTKVFPNKSIKQINVIPSYEAQGELYLGLKDVNPPQQVSILFEMLDEFNISSEEEPPVLDWYYLSNNKWTILKPSNILRDDTNNFLKTGIVIVSLPDTINKNNTVLSSDLFWLKVSVKKNVEVASRNLSVATQVGMATLIGNEELHKSSYLDKPIPRYKIQRSVKSIKGVRSVIQPLPSFGGVSYEKENEFQARTGERLKHRNRAITAWDFERLILDKYKQVEKVVCLPNMTSTSLNTPGNVLIVVSPFADSVLNAKEPKASSELLFDIKSYIQQHASAFARIEVRNPSYERIRIICSVQFSGSHNYGFYIQKLNEDINKYLSGNIGSASLGTQMDKVIYCSDVITYLRTLSYVEYITKFSMVQAARNITGNYELIDTAEEGQGKGGLKATKPWSVLVPADNHQFTILSDKYDEDSAQAGIDYLELGNDFIIKT
jgi:hypothetical protein